MPFINSQFAYVVKKKSVVYMPSCLIVEMMTKLYSKVLIVNEVGDLEESLPDLLTLMRRLNYNLYSAIEACREGRIRYFLGDWPEDKLRVRRILFNLMAKFGYMGERLGKVERELLFQAVEELTREWRELQGIMETKYEEGQSHRTCTTCKYFRGDDPESWQRIMAHALLSLHGTPEYNKPGTYLVVLCYERVRAKLLKMISAMERYTDDVASFNPDKICTVSDEDFPITCSKCMSMTDARRDSELIRNQYMSGLVPKPRRKSTRQGATKIMMPRKGTQPRAGDSGNRYLVPASLKSISNQCKL